MGLRSDFPCSLISVGAQDGSFAISVISCLFLLSRKVALDSGVVFDSASEGAVPPTDQRIRLLINNIPAGALQRHLGFLLFCC